MYVDFKSLITCKIVYCCERKCLKVGFGIDLRQFKVQFAPPPTWVGAAIIAHGTQASDVTYVLSTECNPSKSSLVWF